VTRDLLRHPAALIVGLGEFVQRAYSAVARFHYRRRLLSCGEDVVFDPLSSTIQYDQVRIGSRVYIGPGATIGRADIGDDVMLGPNVSLRDGYHAYDVVGKTMRDSGDAAAGPGRVIVGSDVWIGEGAVLLRRARVPDGVVVGTKAMVHGPVPPYTVVAGTPAAVVRQRFSDDELREHLRLRGVPADRIDATIAERAAGMPAETERSGGR
jgi:acetyltransferase-like isoleucine patch superfamily enzyme